jgi:hypothetical protein
VVTVARPTAHRHADLQCGLWACRVMATPVRWRNSCADSDSQVADETNSTRHFFWEEFKKFRSSLKGAQVALLFYSGHAIQVGGQAYLPPTDIREAIQDEVERFEIKPTLLFRRKKNSAAAESAPLTACLNCFRRDYRVSLPRPH